MSTELAPYHAHIYYDLDDRGTAERLHQEFSKSTGLGDLANLLFVGEMRDKKVGPHPKPQFELHFLEDALPKGSSVNKGIWTHGAYSPSYRRRPC